MPIPQDPDWGTANPYVADRSPVNDVEMRDSIEKSLEKHDNDGPFLDVPGVDTATDLRGNSGSDAQKENICTNRAELIERIKRGESPTWVPNEARSGIYIQALYLRARYLFVSSLNFAGQRFSRGHEKTVADTVYDKQLRQEYLKTNNQSSAERPLKNIAPQRLSPLLPAAELKDKAQATKDVLVNHVLEPPSIERPRSALHAGDFTSSHVGEHRPSQTLPYDLAHGQGSPAIGPLATSPTTPWYTPSSSFRAMDVAGGLSPQGTTNDTGDRRTWRNRAPSLNSYYSSNYVLKAPTTPLVQQSNNTDIDKSPRDRSRSPDKSHRRRTLPPHAFHSISSSNKFSGSPTAFHQSPSYRRESSFPYGHQPRRSLTSNWSLQASTSHQTPPYLRSRRTSFHSEASPLQHASMVGSYEESILRGWMSTAPSRPLDFTAQIGVLSRGDCKPKCPPHVTIPFPAVYYSWGAGNATDAANVDPSPYVGHIDLQQSAKSAESLAPAISALEGSIKDSESPDADGPAPKTKNRTSRHGKKSSPSSRPPRGSYRIPQRGQLQIIIKNPNKTAVKLFLVPYDLEGMEPGTKTFIRQRSYCAESLIDSTPVPKSSPDPSPISKKLTLRYLIHLNICSPVEGRFYLYHQIRVVFANRVPDNKEELRNEIQMPQPRYSGYKPGRETFLSSSFGAGSKFAADNTYRRRSSGFGFASNHFNSQATPDFKDGSKFSQNRSSTPAIPPIPSKVAPITQESVNANGNNDTDAMELDTSRPTTADTARSPLSDKSNRLVGMQLSSSYKSNSSQSSDGYNKLSKGEFGYGGLYGRPSTPPPGEGLLARRLRGLGVQKDARISDDEMWIGLDSKNLG
ncbi:hypothetical protein ACLMJK_001775 [Lecanora helva]